MKVLEGVFGYENVSYPSDGSWVKISGFKLPQGKVRYNLNVISLLIIIPEQYDSIGLAEIYIDRDLRINKNSKWVWLPNTEEKRLYDGKGYIWLCFFSSCFVALPEFLRTLKCYFTDPFSYKKLR